MGARSVLAPPQYPSTDQVADQVAVTLGIADIPRETAGALAVDYIRAWLTTTPGDAAAAERRATLATFYPAGSNASTNDDRITATDPQTVTDIAVTDVTRDSATSLMVAITATVTSGKPTPTTETAATQTLHLVVPVVVNDTGIAIGGQPAIVPETPRATQGQPLPPKADSEQARQAFDILPAFFTAWAASDTAALTPVISDGADTQIRRGLGGTVTLSSVNSAGFYLQQVPTGALAMAVVTVAWTTPDGVTYPTAYTLGMYQDADSGRWYVETLEGGGWRY